MNAPREVIVEGKKLIVKTPGGLRDECVCETEQEAEERARVINYAMTWIGTPFRDCGDVRGPQGGVDCAMSLIRWHADTNIIKDIDPRPYSAEWMLHNTEEKFLEVLTGAIPTREVDHPRIGDVIVYRFGKTFAHGALYIGNNEVLHAYKQSGMCHISQRTDTRLAKIGSWDRPVKYFEVAR